MKRTFVFLFLTGLTFLNVRAQTADETAIRAVHDANIATFDRRDLPEMAALYVKAPSLHFLVALADGMVILTQGWEAMNKAVGGHFKDIAGTKPPKTTVSRYTAHVNGNSAWVTAIVTNEFENGTKHNSCEFVVLEKSAGAWKIAAIVWQDFAEGKLVEVE